MKILITAAMAAALSVPAAASEAASADGARAFAEAAAASFPAPAARPEAEGAVIGDKTTDVDVELNAKTVKCSAADYSGPMLKVLVPGLADLTILNHRNTKEGAPCIAAGRCRDLGPQAILKDGEGTLRIPVRVVLKKLLSTEGDVCHVTLVETVTTKIRGVPFFHERYQAVADRPAADCR
ncbi:MAG TPA: hypothetical protein VN915_08715 [Elusimicrobiota bacterium]|nr:hypothetical protein [Elusimicrobiota bacterium]